MGRLSTTYEQREKLSEIMGCIIDIVHQVAIEMRAAEKETVFLCFVVLLSLSASIFFVACRNPLLLMATSVVSGYVLIKYS